jgi:rhodanese-related sulfurtransferase
MSYLTYHQINAAELAEKLTLDHDCQLVDVREPQELAIAKLPDFINLPLSEANNWAPTIKNILDPEKETIVLCHHGMRSAQMCEWLKSQGFTNVINVIGGIDAYARSIDRNVPLY